MPAYTYSGRPSYTGSTHVVHGETIVPVLLAFVAAASRVQAKALAYVHSQNHRASRCILNTSTQAHGFIYLHHCADFRGVRMQRHRKPGL